MTKVPLLTILPGKLTVPACKVLALGDSYFKNWTSKTYFPNTAYVDIRSHYDLKGYTIVQLNLVSLSNYAVLPD